MVNASVLLAPVFIEIALTFGLLLWAGYLRVQAVRSKQIHPRDVALGQPNWPVQTTKLMNAYHNQLELPVLFYVDPDIVNVPELKDVKTITLSYTMFPVEKNKPVASSAAPAAGGSNKVSNTDASLGG